MKNSKLFLALGLAACVSNGLSPGVKISVGGAADNPVTCFKAEFGDKAANWSKIKDCGADNLETMMLLRILKKTSWDVVSDAEALEKKWSEKCGDRKDALKQAVAAVKNANKHLKSSFVNNKLNECLKEVQEQLKGDENYELLSCDLRNACVFPPVTLVDKILKGSETDAENYTKEILAKYGFSDSNEKEARDQFVQGIVSQYQIYADATSTTDEQNAQTEISTRIGNLPTVSSSIRSVFTLCDTKKAKMIACLDAITGDSVEAEAALKLWAEAVLDLKGAEKVDQVGFFGAYTAKTKRHALHQWRKVQMGAWQKFACATVTFLMLSAAAKNFAPASIADHLPKVLEFGTDWFYDLGKEGSLLGTASKAVSWPVGKVAGMFGSK